MSIKRKLIKIKKVNKNKIEYNKDQLKVLVILINLTGESIHYLSALYSTFQSFYLKFAYDLAHIYLHLSDHFINQPNL